MNECMVGREQIEDKRGPANQRNRQRQVRERDRWKKAGRETGSKQ